MATAERWVRVCSKCRSDQIGLSIEGKYDCEGCGTERVEPKMVRLVPVEDFGARLRGVESALRQALMIVGEGLPGESERDSTMRVHAKWAVQNALEDLATLDFLHVRETEKEAAA